MYLKLRKKINITNIFCLCSISFFLFVLLIGTLKENYVTKSESKVVLDMLRQRSFYVQKLCDINFENEEFHSNGYYERLRHRKIMEDIFVIPERKLAWCLVPKVASTSISSAIISYLLSLEIKNKYDIEKLVPQLLLNDLYPKFKLKTLLKMTSTLQSFYIVRHPFEKLVSAYVNKLTNVSHKHDGQYFYNTYSKVILKNYRQNKSKEIMNLENHHPNLIPDEPTFEEFVDFLLDSNMDASDTHWRPIWLLCQVCLFEFDYVVKYENFGKEFPILVNHLKENSNLPPEFQVYWKNSNNAGESLAKRYIKRLSKKKIFSLFEVYKNDFIYFNYTVDDYLL